MVTTTMVMAMDMEIETEKSLGITTYDLYLGVDDVHDIFWGTKTHRVELVSSMSLKTIHMLSGSIYARLIIQGRWDAILNANYLFVACNGSIRNIIRIRISILRRGNTEEDQGMATSTATIPERDNGDK